MNPGPKHLYTVEADDSSFACLPTVSSFLRVLLGDRGRPAAPRMLREFLAFHEECIQQQAAGAGADIAEARVIVMPDCERPRLALLGRQAASAPARVASEIPMPWLTPSPDAILNDGQAPPPAVSAVRHRPAELRSGLSVVGTVAAQQATTHEPSRRMK